MNPVRSDVLNGWREIAQYVGRDVRTVERWEKQRGLPVRRIPGAGRATVYARVSELEQWLQSSVGAGAEVVGAEVAGTEVAAEVVEPVGGLSEPAVVPAIAAEPEVTAAGPAVTVATVPRRRRWMVVAGAIAAGCLIAALATQPTMRWAGAQRHVAVHAGVTAGAMGHSGVAGVDELYLHGMFFFEQRTPDALRCALQHFEEAIAKDPGYAPAYVGLANTYSLLREYSVMPDVEAFPKAKAAAERAVALDGKLAQAHTSLGFIDYFWSLDAPGAEREFQTALALDPGSALTHHWYGSVLTHEGRYKEALAELDVALRLQPSSSAIFTSRAFAWGLSGHRDEARAMLSEQLAQDRNRDAHSSSTTYTVLGNLAMMEPRDVPGYLHARRMASELRGDPVSLERVGLAEKAYKAGGETGMWRSILASEEKRPVEDMHRSIRITEAAVGLGERDRAFAEIDRLVRKRDRSVVSVFVTPTLFPLRGDPRYAQLRASLQLPEPVDPEPGRP